MNKITDKIEDVQNTPDKRHLDIDKVGIKSIRHPISVKDKTGGDQSTVAMFDMYVHLPHNFKGTHMSRFVESLLDYEVTFIGSIKDNQFINQIKVIIPVTSLCPCSKKISDYGAHNQRSHVTVTVETNDFVWIEDIIELVEKNASSELYGLLKRPDEKYVTEKAYDNPKFVEDMVRDIATDLNQNNKITSYTVESENFESIHNHSAYAMIQSS